MLVRSIVMRRWLVITSLAIHLVVITALFIAGFWRLEQLDMGKGSFSLHDVALPPPPAPAGGPVKVAEFTKKQPKKIVHELVQTRSDVSPTPTPTPDTSSGGGDGSGSGSGSGSDGDTGTCTENCGPPTSETKPEPAPEVKKVTPTFVAPTVLLGLRISGETQIQPPDLVKTTMQHAGDTRVMASFKVCIDTGGGVSSIKLIASSKYAEYDAVLTAKIHDWRYRPYSLNGLAIPVCGVVSFIYHTK
jgi:outer membrane biosynthesis protein TonB